MASTASLPEGTLLFEQQLLRAPFETLRRHFRASQKHVERDFTALSKTAKEATRRKDITPEQAIQALDGMIAKVEGLSAKLSDVHTKATEPNVVVLRKRSELLEQVESEVTNPAELEEWYDTRLDRWVADWALRSGYDETAHQLAHEKEIEGYVDLELFAEIRRIEAALGNRRCTEALAWCSDNKNALRKKESTLEFDLRMQEFIELARTGDRTAALVYLKKHLAPWQETQPHQLAQACTLLAYTPATACKAYKRLYDPSRWTYLQHAFREAIFSLHSLPMAPTLHYALYAGLTALKLPYCYSTDPLHPNCNPDCPVCDGKLLGTLAKEVPWSHHPNSSIICRISGKTVDEDNPPMCFPHTGNVYSRAALLEMAQKRGDMTVVDPRSGEVVHFDLLKKVFIS